MAIHDISTASTAAHGSPIGLSASVIARVKTPGRVLNISIAQTASFVPDGSGPSGPVRPTSGLVYPIYL